MDDRRRTMDEIQSRDRMPVVARLPRARLPRVSYGGQGLSVGQALA